MSSTLVSAQTIIGQSLRTLQAYGVGQSLSAADVNEGLFWLNALMSELSIQSLTIPSVSREVFDITANQSTYTIGPGGNFNTIRPPIGIDNATLLLNTASPPIEIRLRLLTNQAYQAIPLKAQTNTLFTSLFYNPTFVTSGLGTIILWPVPTTAANDLVLYIETPLTEFSDLTTQYQIPPGYVTMLVSNLAVRLAEPFTRPVSENLSRLATTSLANIKRNNVKPGDLVNDFTSRSSGIYNIQTDQVQSIN